MNGPTYIAVPHDAPSAYWEDYAEVRKYHPAADDGRHHLLRTYRCGAQGRSDAQYLVERLASGLYFSTIVHADGTPDDDDPNDD